MDQLKVWLKANGSSFSDIEYEDDASLGRCLKYGKNLARNEQVIKISNSCLVNYWTCLKHIASWNAQVCAFVPKCQEDGENDTITELYASWELNQIRALNSTQLITLYLSLESKRTRSFWKSFLHWLPPLSDFKELPLSWCLTCRKENWKLLPRWCQTHIKEQLESFESDLAKLTPFFGSLLTKEEVLRFWLCVNTRCLYWTPPDLLELESNSLNNITMVPFIDFINHRPVANCEAKTVRSGFVVSTLEDVKAGDHFWFTYGAHDSLFLQCEYGFSIPTEYDYVDVSAMVENMLLKRPVLVQWMKDCGYWGLFTIDNSGDVGFTLQIAIVGMLQNQTQFEKLATGDWKLPSVLRKYTLGEDVNKEYNESIKKVASKIVTTLQTELQSKRQKAYDLEELTIVKLIDCQLEVLSRFQKAQRI